jgi:hypothetical protein
VLASARWYPKRHMPSPKHVAEPQAAEDFLRLALEASNARDRAKFARAGLASESTLGIDADTHALLLRQLYLSHLEQRRFRHAAEVARQMAEVGSMPDIAHHDASRALSALGDLPAAIVEQRLAARLSPLTRRSFHFWCLGTLQHFAGDVNGAVDSLRRGMRWARRDKPLLRAHSAFVRLDSGEGVPKLGEIVKQLAKAPCREGYGQFLLGMLAHHMGDKGRATMHLRAFLRRNASLDPAKATTLREELRRARTALAQNTTHLD